MTAAEDYAVAVDAVATQRHRDLARVQGPERDSALGGEAEGTADDTSPSLTPKPEAQQPEESVLASYVRSDDVLIDVGGGTGRLGLPLARRCREVINVEPSSEMQAAFSTSAAAAGVSNIRTIPADWLTSPEVEGDVALAAHVTYGVSDIVPFIDRLQAASHRRVLILLYAVPAQALPIHQEVHRLLCGEPAEVPPSYRELLPVLWEMGILPDVQILPAVGMRRTSPTIEAAITGSLRSFGAITGVSGLARNSWARLILRNHADRLFRAVGGGYRPAVDKDEHHRGVLITWEPSRHS